MKKIRFKKLQSYVLASFLMSVLILVGSPIDVAAQSATQIRFARGSSSKTIKYTFPDRGTKQYYLVAQKGQYLSANVSSTGTDCAVIRNNDSISYSTSTDSGRNYITISNDCRGKVTVTMTVSIQ